jgi:hypothetical protein
LIDCFLSFGERSENEYEEKKDGYMSFHNTLGATTKIVQSSVLILVEFSAIEKRVL